MREQRSSAVLSAPRMSDAVWRFGVAAAVLVWAAIVAVVAGLGGRPLDVVCDGKVLAAFGLFLCGWTGVWLSPRLTGWPSHPSAAQH
jgi:hypothetical protein